MTAVRRWRAKAGVLGLGLVLAALAAEPLAAPADVEGWGAARWGMRAPDIDAAFDGDLVRLARPLEFAGAYADRMLPDIEIGGLRFAALFQMSAATGRLQQVLLDSRGAQITPRSYLELSRALAGRYGAGTVCAAPPEAGAPTIVELLWRFPTTTVHASFLDFRTTRLLYEDPNTERDLLVPYFERRRIVRRFLPRRIVVRLHASERTDLLSNLPCQAPP